LNAVEMPKSSAMSRNTVGMAPKSPHPFH
jgi:hypothetical protein